MFATLYSKLAAVLFGLVFLMGMVFFALVRYSSELYHHEVTQHLNSELAGHIAGEMQLFDDAGINASALKQVFHMLMVVNPAIEVYLLDNDGGILGYAMPKEKVKRTEVDIEPIRRFLKPGSEYPIMGDNPRDPLGSKIFSAAPIHGAHGQNGYVYVILGGDKLDSISHMLESGYIAHYMWWGIVASGLIALLTGLMLFYYLTRRLHALSEKMRAYSTGDSGGSGHSGDWRYYPGGRGADEIDTLGESFNAMADRIENQVRNLVRTDSQRRELVANVSHDLRTPLASLHGYLETLILKEHSLTEQERRKYIEIAAAHSERLSTLISELFELAKLDSCESLINVEPFSLAELIQDVVQKFKLNADEKGIELGMRLDGNLPFAYGDIALIQRVLENLIVNALAHTPAGGSVSVSLARDSDKIRVQITDTGHGIPPEEVPHIFDRFYRLEKSRGEPVGNFGTGGNAGLGLAIVKRILKLHGSDIAARSEPPQGTTFSFAMRARPC